MQTDTWDPTIPDTLLDAIGLAVAAEVMPNRWFVNGADFTALRKVKRRTDRRARPRIRPPRTPSTGCSASRLW